jgi:hypothetical protein
MDVCSLSMVAKKSIIFCCLSCPESADVDCWRLPVRELKGLVGSGRVGCAGFAALGSVLVLVLADAMAVPALRDLPRPRPSR